MWLTTSHVDRYREQGFLLQSDCFSAAELAPLRRALPGVFAEESPRRVLETNGRVRSVYGSHQTDAVFGILACHPRLVEAARRLLGGDVYVYQFKINAKIAFAGDVWDWHQDYVFWLHEDGLPEPRVTTAVVFLDDVTEFNGPMYFIPSSHREGVIETPARAERDRAYAASPDWISNLTANLKYSLRQEAVAALVRRFGIVAPKGPAGSVLFFDGNVLHASPSNISPFDRVIVLVTYCRTDVVAAAVPTPRPTFLASRDPRPITMVADDALLALVGGVRGAGA
jgi:ectoine hydroxylase-related dioxygenase (phytanoyl-CoA dioxygenase family)